MKALFLVPQVGFNETELFTVKKFLERNNISCSIASFSKGKVIGKAGRSAVAKEVLCNVGVGDFDCFVVVGGMNVASLVEHKCVVKLLEDAFVAKKLVVLLCMSSSLFCSVSGFLKGKKVTVFKSKDCWSVKNLAKHGVVHVDEPVVVDGNIISCRDEKDSLQLAKTIVELLKK